MAYLFWQGRQDSNLQPTVLETATLPIELHPYSGWYIGYYTKNTARGLLLLLVFFQLDTDGALEVLVGGLVRVAWHRR